MGKIKELFKESQRSAHLEPHPWDEHLTESIDGYRSLLVELEANPPNINDPESASYLSSIDVLKDILLDLEEKKVRYLAEIEESDNA